MKTFDDAEILAMEMAWAYEDAMRAHGYATHAEQQVRLMVATPLLQVIAEAIVKSRSNQ